MIKGIVSTCADLYNLDRRLSVIAELQTAVAILEPKGRLYLPQGRQN